MHPCAFSLLGYSNLGKERLMPGTTELPETVTEFLEDGSVAVVVGHLRGWVSSAHLVEPKANQLMRQWLNEKSEALLNEDYDGAA